ncbi:MAG: PIG-L family deacetylase [Acidobacteria bacterium]|nr:PIG-L family deacetylase [Acidobacteriota bacterium]
MNDSSAAGRSLLAVFAHPDDESLACGGLLAWCAALGARVSLLCATRGESGSSHVGRGSTPRQAGGKGPPDDVGVIRARELEAAAAVLGIRTVLLLDYQDGMLPWVDAAALDADIRGAIARLRPDVVVTFGEDGLYWHPDHVAVHERTTAVVAALAEEAPALFYVTMPPGQMRAVVDAVAARRQGPSRTVVLGVDADAFGADAAAPTLVVDAGRFAPRKLAALRCHRSQLDGDPLDRLSDEDAVRLLGAEHFRRAHVGSRGVAFIDSFGHAHSPA